MYGGGLYRVSICAARGSPPASSTSRRQVGTSSGMCVASIRRHSRRPVLAAAPSRRYQRRRSAGHAEENRPCQPGPGSGSATE